MAILPRDDPRQAVWMEYFNANRVLVKSDMPDMVIMPGWGFPKLCYMVDLTLPIYGQSMKERLLEVWKRRGGNLVLPAMLSEGFYPIQVEKVTVVKSSLRLWMSFFKGNATGD